MAKRLDFKLNDQVEHAGMGRGCVTRVSDEYLIVTYSDWRTRGEYDDLWFRNYPNHLRVVSGQAADIEMNKPGKTRKG